MAKWVPGLLGPPTSFLVNVSGACPQGELMSLLLFLQNELDLEKGLEMRKWVLSGILASEETYLSHLEALLLVSTPCWDSLHTSF